jgi:hypothetical protein
MDEPLHTVIEARQGKTDSRIREQPNTPQGQKRIRGNTVKDTVFKPILVSKGGSELAFPYNVKQGVHTATNAKPICIKADETQPIERPASFS